ncbi:MAG: hypothetical protein QW696_03520 [Candidatus Micrarchaeaceae archaeon]
MSATKERVGLDWDNTLAKSIDDIDKFRSSIPSAIMKNAMFALATALGVGSKHVERTVTERGDSIKLNPEIMKVIAEGRYEFYVSTMNGETEAISKLLRDRKIPITVLKSVDHVKSDTEVLVDDNIFTALRRNRRGLYTVLWVNDFNSLLAPIARRMGIPTASNSEELSAALGSIHRQ